ncbi:MAG: sugar phosphate isomerase/epimerase [Treponema sp.]|jgi:sugar phosphate isomerase/epimerase|nr:sugar phosphate isomerase/epimerase [Treponema sp.]
MVKMKIGAQLYSIREYTKTPFDIEESLRRIRAIGYEVVQISGFGPCDTDRLAGWIRETGLEVCGTHVSWASLDTPEELKKTIAVHKKLGAPNIGLGARPGDVFPNSYEGYTRFIKRANEVARRIKDEGLTFGYHNHDFEFEKWNGCRAIDRLIEECPDMLFTLDVFWVQAGGANPIDYIKKLGNRIQIIHFKDYRIKDRTRQFAEIGQGNLDWDNIIGACKEKGIPCAVVEQDGDFLVNPFESLALSRKFLLEKI